VPFTKEGLCGFAKKPEYHIVRAQFYAVKADALRQSFAMALPICRTFMYFTGMKRTKLYDLYVRFFWAGRGQIDRFSEIGRILPEKTRIWGVTSHWHLFCY